MSSWLSPFSQLHKELHQQIDLPLPCNTPTAIMLQHWIVGNQWQRQMEKAPPENPDLSLPKTQKAPAGRSALFCLLFVRQLRRHVHAFHEQAQAPAAEPEGLPAGWAVPFAAQVPTQRGQGQ